MQSWKWVKGSATVLGITIIVFGGAYYYAIAPHHSSAPPESSEGLLDRADTLAWGNKWAEAQPLYARAEELFASQGKESKALYAHVSQVPPDESVSAHTNILRLTEELETRAANDPETKLRILTIRGQIETNYDAGQAKATWQSIEALAMNLHHYQLATRAVGEQGIAAFILGDTETAKKMVVRAWGLSKVEHDPAATVRYASVFGAGLVQIHRYKESLTPLDQAIKTATMTPGVAYPTIAIYAKNRCTGGAPSLRRSSSTRQRIAGAAAKHPIRRTPYPNLDIARRDRASERRHASRNQGLRRGSGHLTAHRELPWDH